MLSIGVTVSLVQACPFCTAVSQTFSQEMESMDIVVIADLVNAPQVPEEDLYSGTEDLPKSQFKVVEVLKGEKWIQTGDSIEVLYFGEAKKDRKYLMTATNGPNPVWTSPLGLSDRAHNYVKQLPGLPNNPSRLEFFQDYLEDEDEMLARDAYDEFAKTPYDGVKALVPKMKHDRLIAWVKNPDVPASRKRLYYTMLGVCGSQKDIPMLEAFMKSTDRQEKSGLDALLACYLMLKKEAGLPLVEDLYFKNKKSEYADTYAAIMAIRFHGTDANVIDRERLVKSLRHMLDRPELADLVIPDLAKWEDWEVMDRMVQLFVEADESTDWVRVPVVNYLRACPLPEAKDAIEKLRKIDPEKVKRAESFFTVKPDEEPADSETDESQAPSDKQPKSSFVPTRTFRDSEFDRESKSKTLLVSSPAPEGSAANADAVSPDSKPLENTTEESTSEELTKPVIQKKAAGVPVAPVNISTALGVPMLIGCVLLVLMRLTLGLPLWKRATVRAERIS